MSKQLTLFRKGRPKAKPAQPSDDGPRWIATGRRPGRTYYYGDTGYGVQHCGHPTAIWPYYAWKPDGEWILEESGRGFDLLARAKAAVEAHYREHVAGGDD